MEAIVTGLIDQHIADREIAIEVVFLRREADETTRLAPVADVVVAEDLDRPRGNGREADDGVDRGRLAGAVGAEKAEEIAALDVERDAVDGR